MKRRSRLEMKADIMRLLAKGDRNKTDISNKEGIYSNTVEALLVELRKNGLVTDSTGKWHLMEKGKRLIKALERIERLLG